jgi:peptide/nickel transport system substrate-binding protein
MDCRYKAWLLVTASIVVEVIASSACQTRAEERLRSTPVPPEPTVVEVTVEATPKTVEVTRIIVETAVVEVTSVPSTVPKQLVVCLSAEPESLYPYSRSRLDTPTTHVLQAIYEDMYTTLSYAYQPGGIEKIPSLADGDAIIRPVTVGKGDSVQDVNGDVVTLKEGVTVRNADGQEVMFEGQLITMSQMMVQFMLQPLVWSDGRAVTADDSVYSFELAAEADTPVSKYVIDRTADYAATSERTIVWTGLPGYLDPSYFTNIWSPYPRHYWGDLSAAELLTARESTTNPLSSGPFVVAEWQKGDYIQFSKNAHYYRSDQQKPRIDTLLFKFMTSTDQLLANLLSGECDIATHDTLTLDEVPALLEAEQGDHLIPHFRPGTVFEHIDFGIAPVDEYAVRRPDWFANPLVRQALVMCTDRQRMVDEILYGKSEVIHAYVPAIHPLYSVAITEWPHDVTGANVMLDEAGYLDSDGDGWRDDPATGITFRVTLLGAFGNDIASQIGEIFQANMADCGLDVRLQLLNGEDYFADGPEGPLFGRKFDLAAFPWLIGMEPNCSLYLSSRIPGPENGWKRTYNNQTGFSNEAFDAACETALNNLPGMPGYESSHQEALRIWSKQMPIIPLFSRLKIAATRPGILNFALDATQTSELWNLYGIDLAPVP